MRRKSNVSFGPGAASLILIVVILSMSVLGMLALMNARNDSRLSERAASVVAAGYELSATAERTLAALDNVAMTCGKRAGSDDEYLAAVGLSLPANMTLEGREISWSESDGLRTLDCTVELLPLGGQERLSWRKHRLSAVTEEAWN